MSDTPTFNTKTRWKNVNLSNAVGAALSVGVAPQLLDFPCIRVQPRLQKKEEKGKKNQDVYDFVKEASGAPIPGIPPLDPQRSVDGERGIEIINPISMNSESLDLETNPSGNRGSL